MVSLTQTEKVSEEKSKGLVSECIFRLLCGETVGPVSKSV